MSYLGSWLGLFAAQIMKGDSPKYKVRFIAKESEFGKNIPTKTMQQ